MLHFLYKKSSQEPFSSIPSYKDGCWVHSEQTTLEDLKAISEITHVELHNLQDTLDKYEVPRVEKILNDTLIFTRHPSSQEKGVHTATMAVLITEKTIVTISPTKCPLVDEFISKNGKIATKEKMDLFLHLFSKIIQEFSSQIKRIRTHVLLQEQEIDQDIDSEEITILTKQEGILNQYISTLIPLREVLESIISKSHLKKRDQDLVEDLLNACIQLEEACSINLRTIRSLRDCFQIIFTNQLNKTIKLLTGLTIIVSFPAIIASIYGMNVPLPIQNEPYAFFIVIALTLLLSIGAIFFFRRKKWL
jgi:magnesium transporter